MKIEDIKALEDANVSGELSLYKEGLFWRAYNRSAYLFVHHLQEVKVLKKYYKVIDDSILVLGIPQKSCQQLLQALPKGILIEKQEEKMIVLSGFTWDEEAYQAYYKQLPLHQPQSKAQTNENNQVEKYQEIIDKLKDYPLSHRTPMEAQQFLGELQKELHGFI
jgi:hypothetical protein